MISYAQNLEDVLLHRLFRRQPLGTYVDVGAHDPHFLSVTKHFYVNRGWAGINIEPVLQSFQKFVADRPRDINLNLAVGAATGEIDLLQTRDPAYSSVSSEVVNAYSHRDRAVERVARVSVRTLTDILDEFAQGWSIDFLKIDVEGWEKEVLDGMDFTRHRPIVLVIEAIKPDAQPEDFHDGCRTFAAWHGWEPQVLDAGYQFAYFDGLNRFYVAAERTELLASFAVPVGPLYDKFTLAARQPRRTKGGMLERLANSTRKRLWQKTSSRVN